MKNVLLDSGFWFALLTEGDQHHERAVEIFNQREGLRFLIPFPSLYETVNTKFVKEKNHQILRAHINSLAIELVHDDRYKQDAYDTTLQQTKRDLSLVDMVIRLMLEDPDLHIEALVTFNPKDFVDICQNRQVEMIC